MIKKLNIVLFVLGLVIMGVLNLFFYNRSEVSASENRVLAKFPEYSPEAVKNGSYFKGIEDFYADRFLFRDSWISLSNRISALKGISGEDEVEIISMETGDQFAEDPSASVPSTSETSETEEIVAVSPSKAVVSKLADVDNRVKLYKKKEIQQYFEKNPAEAKEAEVKKNPADNSPNIPPAPNMEIEIGDRDANEIGEMRSSFLVLKDAAYELFGYSKASCQFYAESINQFAGQMPREMRVFSLVAPSHIEFIQNKKYREMSASQEEAIQVINSFLDARIQPVDARGSLLPHYEDYLYFRSDHHWTARGGYYAYEAFVDKAGFQPVTLDQYEKKEFPGFLGTLYDKTRSRKVAANPDVVEVFMPKVGSTFRIHTRGGGVLHWNVINESYGKPSFKNKYLVFLSGDEPLSIIQTDVDTTRKILVFKDSYGNAMIPFLMNHYKEIHIIDPRHYQSNAVKYAKENGFDDVLFINYGVVVAGNTNFAKNIRRVSQ